MNEALQREIARADAFYTRLDIMARSLGTLTTRHGDARALLFRVLDELLIRFALLPMMGPEYKLALSEIAGTKAGAGGHPGNLDVTRHKADALASRLCSRGFEASWPIDHQVPFDLATLLRRACEREAGMYVALAVLDVQRLLDRTKMRRDPDPIDVLITEATGGAWRWPVGPCEVCEDPALASRCATHDNAEPGTDPIARVPEGRQTRALSAGLGAAGKVYADAWRNGEEGSAVVERAQEARNRTIETFATPPRALAPEVEPDVYKRRAVR